MDENQDTACTHSSAESRLADAFQVGRGATSVAVVEGHGVRLGVEQGHLTCIDGVADLVRNRSWAKATHGLSRVAILAQTGDVSISALKWCAGAGVGVVVVDPFDGGVLATSAHTSNDDPRLRRAQALALGAEVGLIAARKLIGEKLGGQASMARDILEGVTEAETILKLQNDLDRCQSIDEVRQLEAAAANVYFSCWRNIEVPFIKKDLSRIPGAWRTFEGRRSSVNPGTSRSATDPLNALLNYCYRLLEAEGRIGCLAIGLDPGLGILHADEKSRDSMVLDLIEPIRPVVDRYILTMLKSRPLRKADVAEDARGVVRLRAPLTHEIAQSMPEWGKALGAVIEQVAEILGNSSPYDVSVPSVLTKSKHRQAARKRIEEDLHQELQPTFGPNTGGITSPPKRRQKPRTSKSKATAQRCQHCGDRLLAEADRVTARGSFCPPCLAARRVEVGRMIQALPKNSRPTSPQVTAKRSQGNGAERIERKRWEIEHSAEKVDRERFLAEVLPGLRGISLTRIAKATGMSTSAASKVRSGKMVPHPRHWTVMASLVTDKSEVSASK